MNIIVAVDKNWAIGNKGKLLLSLPSDMRFFKTTTQGKC
ncbi:MAG: dihydrofolate reductase, partial [Eubacteriales bacterium]